VEVCSIEVVDGSSKRQREGLLFVDDRRRHLVIARESERGGGTTFLFEMTEFYRATYSMRARCRGLKRKMGRD
jgi:hypothetical protein